MGPLKQRREKREMDEIRRFAQYVDSSNKIVAVTGAGISLSGGGVTYGQLHVARRGSGGDDSAFLRSFLDNMFSYDPSYAHYALKELEDEGKMLGIITTNVDCMHTIAGSKNVAEIQGSLQINVCEECGRHYDTYKIWQQKDLPKCPHCGGTITPWPIYSHIDVWDKDVRKARLWISQADLIIVIGTHGYYGGVYWNYRNSKAPVVQINPGRTSFDYIADLNIREGSDEAFRKLKEIRSGNGGKKD